MTKELGIEKRAQLQKSLLYFKKKADNTKNFRMKVFIETKVILLERALCELDEKNTVLYPLSQDVSQILVNMPRV